MSTDRDAYIKRIVAAAPPLTPAQRDKLASQLAAGHSAAERKKGSHGRR